MKTILTFFVFLTVSLMTTALEAQISVETNPRGVLDDGYLNAKDTMNLDIIYRFPQNGVAQPVIIIRSNGGSSSIASINTGNFMAEDGQNIFTVENIGAGILRISNVEINFQEGSIYDIYASYRIASTMFDFMYSDTLTFIYDVTRPTIVQARTIRDTDSRINVEIQLSESVQDDLVSNHLSEFALTHPIGTGYCQTGTFTGFSTSVSSIDNVNTDNDQYFSLEYTPCDNFSTGVYRLRYNGTSIVDVGNNNLALPSEGFELEDKIFPRILYAESFDTNGDQVVDKVEIILTESVKDSINGVPIDASNFSLQETFDGVTITNTFDIFSTSIEELQNTNTINDQYFSLTFTSPLQNNFNSTGVFIFIHAGSIQDIQNNASTLTGSGVPVTDGIPPRIRNALTLDTDGDGRIDKVEIELTEDINDTNISADSFSLTSPMGLGNTDTLSGFSTEVTVIANDTDANDRYFSLSFTPDNSKGTGIDTLRYFGTSLKDTGGNTLLLPDGYILPDDRAFPMILNALTLDEDGDSIAIAYNEVVAQTIMFSIGGGATGWTSDITGDDFITLDTDMNVAQDTGVAITVRATPTENTGTDERIATITFTTTGGTGVPASARVTVTQSGIPVYPESITLINQAQVDTIRNTLGRATAIGGNLIIGSSTDITHLDSLYFLTGITGNLEISNNSMLEDVGDFPALDSIGGNFFMHNNSILRNAGNFPMLSGMGGYFLIRASDSLTSVGSFPRLATIGGSFSVRGNKILRVLYEFPALTSIGVNDGQGPYVPSQGGFEANASIVVEGNPLLFYCCGLSRFFSGRSNATSGDVYIGSDDSGLGNSTGCNSEEDISCDVSSRLPSDTFMLPFHTTDTTFILHSQTHWRLSREEGTEANWITGLSLDGGSTNVTDSLMGDQTASIAVTYAQNGTSESRTARLRISFLDTMGGELTSPMPYTLTLIQEEVMPTLQPSPSTVNVSHLSGNTNITLTANNVKWRLRKDSVADWITMLSVGAISHTDTLTATNNSFVPTDTVVTITYEELPISLADRSTSLVLEAIDNDGGVLDDLSPITITLTQAIAPYMGDITLTTQEGVDTIRNTLGRATAIGGNLIIGSSTDITHLDSLYFLTKITGNLEIRNNSMLEDVGDFPALDSIGGYFLMHSNTILRNAGNFPMLSGIGGYFLIRASDSLTSVGFFPRLTTIGESFSVRGTKILRVLYEFPSLTNIGTGSPYVPSVDALDGMDGFPGNTSIVVEDNPLLEYCCVLTRLREGGGITISGGRYINNNFEGCNSIEMSNCSLSVRLSVDDTVRLPFFSEETTFTLYSNTRWQLSRLNPGDADWVTSLSSGVGEGVANNLVGARDTRIKVNHTPNANRESRTVRLIISFLDEPGNNVLDSPVPDTLTLIQEEVMPTLQLPPDTVNVSHFSGSTGITLSANNVKWRLRKDSGADWITMLSVGAISHTDTLIVTNNSFVPTDTEVTITYDKLPISLVDRSTSLVLEAIDNDGGVLDDLSPITITLTQAIAPYMGDITLTTQQAVNTIRNTLGNPRVTTIVGNLIIGASSDITNLDSLRFLTEITGDFFIGNTNNGNDSLKDIGGFPFLQKIGGNYYVTENPELVNGGNFPVLDSIGGYFFIRMNAKLESVGSFPRLKDIGTYFSIRSSGSLRSLYEFPALTSIGNGSPHVPSTGGSVANTSIVVEDNPLLFYCCGLSRFFSGRSNPASGGAYIGSNSTGCDSEEEISCDIFDQPLTDTLRLPFHTTDTTFILHSQTRWRLSREEGTEADWITELSSGGTPVTDSLMGDQTASITVTYAQNGTAESRTARLRISFLDESGTVLDSPVPDTLMLIQEEVMPTLQPSSSTVNVSDLSGNTNITLTANNVKWRLRKDSVADWLTMLSVGATNHTDTLIVTNNSFVPTDTVVTITYEELPISLTNRRALLVLESIDDEGNMLANVSPITITFTQMAPSYMRDVVLINQAQVDSIRSTLGNPRITVIDGYLQIGPSNDITNLDSLNFLTEITENFFIGGVNADNSALTNIGDFPNLQKIGGGYSVAANTELIHGGNFPALESIGDKFIASGGTSGSQNAINVLHGYFFIRSNPKLESLGTFPRLKRIGTFFTARGHDSLRFLYDFPSLTSIGTGSPFVPSTPSPGSTSIVVEDNPLLFYCYTLTEFLTGGTHAVSGKYIY